MFDGFEPDAFRFLQELKENNNEAFYRENRERYERVLRLPLRALCEECAPVVRLIDPDLDTRPASAMSRLRRDTRFTQDKSPFRDHVWIGWRYPGERRSEGFHMYWGFGVDWYSWGCGSYGPDKPLMDALRALIVRDPETVRAALRPLRPGVRYHMFGARYARLTAPEEVPEDLRPLWEMRYFGFECEPGEEGRAELRSHAAAERLTRELMNMAPILRLTRRLRGEGGVPRPEKPKARPGRARSADEFEF